MFDLIVKCRQKYKEMGIGGRTNSFALVLSDMRRLAWFKHYAELNDTRMQRLLEGIISDRFCDYFDRKSQDAARDLPNLNFFISQGYKRGVRWQGVPLGKTCFDISIYQQMLQEIRPGTIIEFGTALGASAMYFADCCRMFDLETEIITIDKKNDGISSKLFAYPNIQFILGDVLNVEELLPAQKLELLPHPWLVVEDAHTHLSVIVNHLYPFLATGDYFVVEDLGVLPEGEAEIARALRTIQSCSLKVDTFYTDMFGRNTTSSPDSIFRYM